MIQSLGTNFVNTSAAEKITEDLAKGKNLILAIMQQLIGKLKIFNSTFHWNVTVSQKCFRRINALGCEYNSVEHASWAGTEQWQANKCRSIIVYERIEWFPVTNVESSHFTLCWQTERRQLWQRASWSLHRIIRPECGHYTSDFRSWTESSEKRLFPLGSRYQANDKRSVDIGETLSVWCMGLHISFCLTNVLTVGSYVPCQRFSFSHRKNYQISQSNRVHQYLRTSFSICFSGMPTVIYRVRTRQPVGQMKNCCNGWTVTHPIKKGEWRKRNWKPEIIGQTFIHRLELVSGALQKYRTIVRQKSIAQYDPVYPIISNFLEKFYRTIASWNGLECRD